MLCYVFYYNNIIFELNLNEIKFDNVNNISAVVPVLCVCVCVCVCARARACVCACVCVSTGWVEGVRCGRDCLLLPFIILIFLEPPTHDLCKPDVEYCR